MNDFYKDKLVAVTGGNGFVGSHVVERLVSLGAKVRVVGRQSLTSNLTHVSDRVEFVKADLLSKQESVESLRGAELVIHLASKVGGVQFNVIHPAEMFTPNVVMSLNVLDACVTSKSVDRVLVASSTCVYRRFCTIPAPEEEGFIEDPEPTNVGYGWAKRMTEKAAMLYAKEYGLKTAVVRPENIYGPRDNFDVEYAHVIASLIRRAIAANNEFVIWGSGKQTRSFFYVEDAAEAILLALERHPEPDAINIGSSYETTITDLATLLLKILKKDHVRLVFDTSKPEGQPRKASDTRKMKSVLGFTPKYRLEEGLEKTVKWVLGNPWCLN